MKFPSVPQPCWIRLQPAAFMIVALFCGWIASVRSSSFTVKKANVRRLLDTDSIYMGIPDECTTENYKVSVFMDKHMYLVARPSLSHADIAEDCPTYLFHYESSVKASEELILDTEESKELNKKYLENSLLLTHAKLDKIVEAFEAVEMNPEEEYEIVLNNCASFCVHMAGYLDAYFTPIHVIEYVAHGKCQ